MHQPIDLEQDEADYYPMMVRPEQPGIHLIYKIAGDVAQQQIAEYERKFSRFGYLTAVFGVALGSAIVWLMG